MNVKPFWIDIENLKQFVSSKMNPSWALAICNLLATTKYICLEELSFRS
jgi:hypothetical protein